MDSFFITDKTIGGRRGQLKINNGMNNDQKLLAEAYSTVARAEDIKMTKKILKDYIKQGCNGDLELFQIDVVPDTLTHVRGYFSLQETVVRKLPDNLTVDEALNLWGCDRLEVLPKGLKVGGVLQIEQSGITSVKQLPDDIQVGEEIISDWFSNEEARAYLASAKARLETIARLPELEGVI